MSAHSTNALADLISGNSRHGVESSRVEPGYGRITATTRRGGFDGEGPALIDILAPFLARRRDVDATPTGPCETEPIPDSCDLTQPHPQG